MKKLVTLVAAFCGVLALPVLAQEKQEKPQDKPKEAAAPAAAKAPAPYKLGSVVDEKIVLTDLDGKTLSFADLRGKVVFLHFWSTQCPFEVVADPKTAALEELWKGKKDVVVLSINSNASEIGAEKPADGYAAIKAHMQEKGLKNRVFADHGNKVADLFQASSTPHCFVLDQKGAIVYAGGLDDDPKGDKGEATQQYVRDAVEAVLAGQEVKVKQSKPYGCSIKRVKV